ncbi:MAG: class I SAM-dependent methyltransferase, partial [bacterium]
MVRDVKHETAMGEPPWYVDLFGEDYLRVWAPVLPPERTAQELEGITKLLNLSPGSAILDLCCGHGRHAIPLAQRGFRVTGLDLSDFFLQRAAADTRSAGVEVRWIHGDMRSIPFETEFDAVINIFTSFGYFDRDEENRQVLHQVYKALKPGGVFLMEAAHREGVVRRFTPYSITRHDDGLISLEERRIDLATDRRETRVTLLHTDGR